MATSRLILRIILAVLLLTLLGSCNGNASETLGEISIRRQCRANMNTLCTDQANYCDANGEWASDIDKLDEHARRANPLRCPETDEEYLMELTECGYIISCPAGHGSINTGRVSWTGGD
jgi:hypothetical protein